MPFLNYEGAQIYYDRFGQGIPLLFIHEWNTSSNLFKRVNLPDFKEKYQVILFDLPGFGKSDLLPQMTFDKITDLIVKIMDTLEVPKVHVIGFCLGSAIALDFAIRYPERMNKLVLMEALIDFPLICKPLLIPHVGNWIVRFFAGTMFGSLLFKKVMFKRGRENRGMFTQETLRANINVSMEYMRMVYHYGKIKHYERSKSLTMPTLCMNGELSLNLFRRCTRKLSQVIPLSKYKSLRDCKHFIPLEKPRIMYDVVDQFICDQG